MSKVASLKGKSTPATDVVEPQPLVPESLPQWTGGLSKDELARPGGILIAMLVGRANECGHQMQEMAAYLGVTYGYFAQLRSGHRKTEHISDVFVSAAALYLGVPRMTVMLAAGQVRPEDVFEKPHHVALEIPRAIELIAKDAVYGPLVPPELRNAGYETQFLVVRLFEAATGRKLLSGQQDPQAIARYVLQLQEEQALVRQEFNEGQAAKSARRLKAEA